MKPSQALRCARSLVALHIPFFMKGAVGVGKSQVIKQLADELKIELRDVRLSQMDPTDIKGFPSPDAAKGVMRWLPADFLPTKGKGILFLDELPSAPQAVQAASYQLVLDRAVGSYRLPPGWAVCAAGNRDIDRAIVNRMPSALANRLVHIDFEVDVEDWVDYAVDSGLSAELIAFIRFRTNLLHSFDATQNPSAFPTPRSWFTVDKLMKAKLAEADEYELTKGTVGDGAAAELRAFLKVVKDLPSVDEIKLTPDSTKVPDSPATLYALTTALSMNTATPSAFSRFMLYVQRMPVEFQVVYVRDCLKRVNAVKMDPAFTAWSLKHQDVVL